MTWTKHGAEYFRSPKMLRVPAAVRWLHSASMGYANEHGTDGYIPAAALAHLYDGPDPAAAAAQLVAAHLWEPTEDGWMVVDFLDDQPSAADVARLRELDRARQRKRRAHQNGDHSLCDPRYCRLMRDTKETHGVTHAGTPGAAETESDMRDPQHDSQRKTAMNPRPRTEPSEPSEPQRSGGEAGKTGRTGVAADPLALLSGDGGPPVSQFAAAGLRWSTSTSSR